MHLDRPADRDAPGDGGGLGADLSDHAGHHHRHLPRSDAACRRHRSLGSVTGLGVAVGPIMGGALLEFFWWGSLVLALAPIALTAALGALVFIPHPARPGTQLDRGGLLLSVVMLGALVYTIIEAPTTADCARTLAGFAVALTAAWHSWCGAAAGRSADRRQSLTNLRFSAASGAVTVAFFALFGSSS